MLLARGECEHEAASSLFIIGFTDEAARYLSRILVARRKESEIRPAERERHAERLPFVADELERRRALSYPPFSTLIRVVCLSREPGPEVAAAMAVRERIEAPGTTALGPAALFRLKGRDRAQVLVKAPADPVGRAGAVRAVRRAVESLVGQKEHKGVGWSVDVDPQ